MPFLTLNGVTVRVADKTASRRMSSRGRRGRAYSGQARDGTRGQRRTWRFRTKFESFETSETFQAIIHGLGHTAFMTRGWECAMTSLMPEHGVLSDVRFDRTLGPFASPFETGVLRTDASGVVARYHAQLGERWTVHWAQTESALGTWHFLTKRDDGAFWDNGVRDDTLWETGLGNLYPRVRNGSVEWFGEGVDEVAIHHVAMLPYRASPSIIERWGVQTKPWGPLPFLRMEGDALVVDHTFVEGEVVDVGYFQVGDEDEDFGRLRNNAEVVEFELREWPNAFTSDPVSVGP